MVAVVELLQRDGCAPGAVALAGVRRSRPLPSSNARMNTVLSANRPNRVAQV